MNYKTIQQDGVTEEEIKKSRFICQIKRVSSEEEARTFIAQIKKEHHKANHSCSAMIIGDDAQIKRSSDDGEPSGTAGIPMLTVLEKQDLTNLVVVVTRYFGGIKLGASGLIRAYAGSVANGIKTLGVVEVKALQGLKLTLTYPQYQHLDSFLEKENLAAFDTDFGSHITTSIYLDDDHIPNIIERLTDYYQGKITIEKIDKKIVELPLES